MYSSLCVCVCVCFFFWFCYVCIYVIHCIFLELQIKMIVLPQLPKKIFLVIPLDKQFPNRYIGTTVEIS